MKTQYKLPKQVIAIGYSVIFITVSYFLLLKTSPIIFNFLNFLPLLLIGSLLKTRASLISFFISAFFIFLVFSSILESKKFDFSYVISNIFLTFCFAFLFILLVKNKKFSWGQVLNIYTIISASILIFIFLSIFSDQMDVIFEEIKNQYSLLFLNKEGFNELQIDSLFSSVKKIFPSINFIFHLFTILINFYLSNSIIKKFNFKSEIKVDYKDFEIDNWVFFLLLAAIILSFLTVENFNVFLVNISISVSFIFFLKGYNIFFVLFDKFNLTKFIKYLLIFLLFAFFGYFLIFSLFFVGVIDKLRKILNR
tara:strand:- start:151 stop:1077 length:927 start_codon:yes stop_codon:yes gene_type:complete